jgi:hypothetical protein
MVAPELRVHMSTSMLHLLVGLDHLRSTHYGAPCCAQFPSSCSFMPPPTQSLDIPLYPSLRSSPSGDIHNDTVSCTSISECLKGSLAGALGPTSEATCCPNQKISSLCSTVTVREQASLCGEGCVKCGLFGITVVQ